jgi:hypothetical protein
VESLKIHPKDIGGGDANYSFDKWAESWTDTGDKLKNKAKAVKSAAEKTVNDTVDSINSLERKEVYDVANYTSLALTAASLSPCSIYCTLASGAIDGLVAFDQFSQGDTMGGIITLAPLASGEMLKVSMKAGKIGTQVSRDQRAVAASILLNKTLNHENGN